MAVRYSVVDVDDVDPGGPSGAVRFLRRAVGATNGREDRDVLEPQEDLLAR